jgi:hypothetical protein
MSTPVKACSMAGSSASQEAAWQEMPWLNAVSDGAVVFRFFHQ